MNRIIYKTIIRPILFIFPPEISHYIVENFLYFLPDLISKKIFNYTFKPKTKVILFGEEIPSPVGIAAGLDKNCKSTKKYLDMGFGFSVIGTVMKNPRKGNPKPRLIRTVKEKSLINSLSFPSDGSYVILNRLKKLFFYKNRIIVSVSGLNEDEILDNLITFNDYCFAFEINISSPNTKDLKKFINPDSVNSIASKARKITNSPILFKLPRFPELSMYIKIIEAISKFHDMGVVIANSMPVEDERLKVGVGGKSGPELFDHTLKVLNYLRPKFKNMTIICSGGISGFNQTDILLKAGANAVQIYTSIIYEGPALAKDINENLFNN